MSYSMADEYDRRMRARRIEYERRCDAVVYDPNNPLTMFPEAIVDREMAAEAVTAAAARAEAYAVMSAECFAQIAARRVQEGWEPLDSVTVIDDDEPSRPQREPVSMEVERRLALRGGESSLVKAADIEQEILLERYEADLAAGVVDDEDSPFF